MVSNLRRTGPTSQLLGILRHVDRSRFEPVVITLSREPADSMAGAFAALDARVESLGMSRLGALVQGDSRRLIERLLGTVLRDGSVVHTQGIRSDVLSARHLADVPRVCTARNDPRADYPAKYGRIVGRWMARTHLRAFRSLPVVVACSSALADTLKGYGIEARVIRNGVDAAHYRPPLQAERAEARAQLGVPEGARFGLIVGALSARKDPLTVVRAARATSSPHLRWVFLGSGPLAPDCRREAGDDRRIRFAGQVSDVATWLRAADFFVSASRSEGLPNAALEAMASGLPLVLSDIGPHRELQELSPASVILFPCGDADALAKALGAARATSVPDVSAIGSKRMSASYQDLYQRIAQGTAGR